MSRNKLFAGIERGKAVAVAGALAVLVAGSPLIGPALPGQAAVPAAAPVPMAAKAMPSAVEALSPYLPQKSCDPDAKPGVKAFSELVLGSWKRGSSGGVSRDCGRGGSSEHKEGRAWDWMLDGNSYEDTVAGQQVVDWLLADDARIARRMGIMYIIWHERIWSSYKMKEEWRGYHYGDPHTDHIHISFGWAGAMARTSWWTGKVAPVEFGPCRRYIGEAMPEYTEPNTKPCPKPVRKPKAKPAPEPVPAWHPGGWYANSAPAKDAGPKAG
ncbi:MAG: hypothetical protein ACT4QF_19045 [Sporichthyaceae bacterium]